MSDSAVRLASLLAQEEWIIGEIVDAIELDPALTGRLLGRANSASSGNRHPISSAQAAVTRVGPGVVLSLAIASVVRDEMQLPLSAYGLSEGELWRHSVASALAVEQARRFCEVSLPPQGFAAALLHDIGKLVLGRHLQPEMLSLLDGVHDWAGQPTFVEMEAKTMGIHHAGFGGLIARNWGLPAGIVAGITYHHAPDEAPDEESLTLASLVAVADFVAHQIGEGRGPEETPVPWECMQRLGITRDGFEALCEATDDELEQALELYS